MCSGDLTAFPDRLLYDQRIIENRRLGMRKPRDFDAELKILEDKAKTLKDRKVRQLGELVIATGADVLDIDTLAGGLLDLADAANAARKEAWRKRGAGFFRGGPSAPAPRAGGEQ
ncbi:conjugal transfer protein TraD [Caulobacter sp.]|uniref:conjugal transfer protein TraD n=1 Tax=Caulobacter sp. TaxID=78 RepID=UPI002B45DF86|nr:conjugal transfer protein TraD [Caulobacter sp.]HJV43354.1 conjugal transfer protein TraD [Caulobacter sp.]